MQPDTAPLAGNEKGTHTVSTLGGTAHARLGFLVRQFHRAIERQRRHDGEVIAGLVRVLRNPRGDARQDAEHFAEFVRAIARQEMSA
jgi:hypothetical protein